MGFDGLSPNGVDTSPCRINSPSFPRRREVGRMSRRRFHGIPGYAHNPPHGRTHTAEGATLFRPTSRLRGNDGEVNFRGVHKDFLTGVLRAMADNLHIHRASTQAISRTRQQLSRLSLKQRFLLIMGASLLFLTLVFWAMFDNFTEQLIARIGVRFAEKQMLYDKARTLQPLINEIDLARHYAEAPPLKEWAANEHSAALYRDALMLVETLRNRFSGGSYFVALARSGNFYYNDVPLSYRSQPLRYTLNPAESEDKWFFDFIGSGDAQRIYVAQNNHLGVNNIWIMVPIRQGDKVVGALGTGMNLHDFMRNVAGINQPGVTNMFIDRNAAIQIYNDAGHVDIPGVLNYSDHTHTIAQVQDMNADGAWIHRAIRTLDEKRSDVVTEFVQIDGKRYLAGVIALPEVGWYDLTLLDLSVLLPRADFVEMGAAIIVGLLGLLLILAFSLHNLVLGPVAMLTDAAARIRRGDYSSALPEAVGGEVSELVSQFHGMADAIHNTQHWLEAEIEQRTRQLADAKKILEISLQHEKDGRETQANLMALMAHEMRNPVAVIGNTAQMLNRLAQTEHPSFQPRIEKIMRSVKQLAALMDHFLTEKWLDMDRHGLNRQAGDLNRLCADVAQKFMESHARTVQFVAYDGTADFVADWELLRIAIVNLLDNANKYSTPDSEIFLKTGSCDAGRLCVEVSDRGAGIAPELQATIFEKFARGRHDSDIQGSGLGLYLVNWIARFHGGHTEVVSTEGQGSIFCLCLPTGDSISTSKMMLPHIFPKLPHVPPQTSGSP